MRGYYHLASPAPLLFLPMKNRHSRQSGLGTMFSAKRTKPLIINPTAAAAPDSSIGTTANGGATAATAYWLSFPINKNILLAKWFGNEGFGAFGSHSPALRFTSLHFVFALIGFRNNVWPPENRLLIINPTVAAAPDFPSGPQQMAGLQRPNAQGFHFQKRKRSQFKIGGQLLTD